MEIAGESQIITQKQKILKALEETSEGLTAALELEFPRETIEEMIDSINTIQAWIEKELS